MSSIPEPLVKILLLGTFEVRRGTRVLHAGDWSRKKASALLKRLALERRLLKDQAIEFLWPGIDPASAANNLYKTLHVLRRSLDTAFGPGTAEAILRFEDGAFSLLPSVWVDAQEFERLCAASLSVSSEQQVLLLTRALDLYQGDLLPDDLYADWTAVSRERLHRLQREARLALAVHYREVNEFTRALELLRPLLAYDPADEPVHCEVMRLYALAGQRHLALRQYQDCVEALAAEIDAPPAAETEALYAQILAGELIPSPSSQVKTTIVPEPSFVDKPAPLFVGRAQALSILQSHLQAAAAGEGRIIFVTGEAGQGKTSLLAQFAHRSLAEFPDLVIAAGSCQALVGFSDPYLPFRDLIAMLSGDWQRPWLGGGISAAQVRRLQAVAPETVRAIAALAPDLVDIIAPPGGPGTRDASPAPDLNQHQIFDQMGQLLRALAAKQPLLLLLDDLQWIDAASANLLFYLGRQLIHSAVLIAGAYRPSEVNRKDGSEHPLAAVVQEFVRYRGDILIDLDASIPEEERSFVDALLDSEPNRLDSSFREALYRRTKGHPLFTVELLRALQEQGDLIRDEGGMWKTVAGLDWDILPARVEAVIARRIETLPQELHQALAVASVEGEIFSVEVLAQVQGKAVRPLLHQLSQQLDRRYRLVRELGEARLGSKTVNRYQFRHNLFQQYLYHQLGAAERRTLHAEIAAVLEQIGEDGLDLLAVSLAHHYLAAGDAAKAVLYLRRAGDEARRRVAIEEAIQFYESALENWQDNNVAARAEVLHRLGEWYLALGNSTAAIQYFVKAEKFYALAGIRTGMGAMHRLIGRSYWEQGERARALASYHQALALLEQEPESAELARAISAISQMHMVADEHDEAITWGERALVLARELQTEDVILHALTSVGASLVTKGEAERGLAMLAESQERAEALGMPHDSGRAYAGWGDSLMSLERYGEARAVYEQMLTYARKVQMSMFEGVALAQSGYLDWWAGRWGQAWARRQEIIEWMVVSAGSSMAKVWASSFLGMMYNDLGLPETACTVLADVSGVARSANEPQTTVPHLGQLARCARSEAERKALVQEILLLIDSAAYPRYEILPALQAACSWLAQNSSGDPISIGRLEKIHWKLQSRQSAATLEEVRAYAAGLREEWNQAVSHYQSAAGYWEALERPYDLLRTLAGLMKALSFSPANNAHTEARAAVREVRLRADAIIARLANELNEPEVKQAFLASTLVMEVRKGMLSK